eukprot:TRINITY_DN336_c1_g1_i1.p1 TRINITY_DN336_c1_g1~~TRINITY_DN336_c1_g1_i1.p1  ORF type:complete len:290 (+),score=56.36 TRINITY_DN336_c1_g1_i1:25-870(+)
MNYETTPPLGRFSGVEQPKREYNDITECAPIAYYYFVNVCAAAFLLAYVISFNLEDWAKFRVPCDQETSVTFHFDLWKYRVTGCCCSVNVTMEVYNPTVGIDVETNEGLCCDYCNEDESYASCNKSFCSSGLSAGVAVSIFSLLIVALSAIALGLQTLGSRLPFPQERIHYSIVSLWAAVAVLSLLCYIVWTATAHHPMESFVKDCGGDAVDERDGSVRVSFLAFFLSMALAILTAFRDKQPMPHYTDLGADEETDYRGSVQIPLNHMSMEGEAYQSVSEN